ncbi:MAG: DNA-processing protein DprA [Deinococcales bacterium]
MSETRAALALFFTPGLGAVRIKALLEFFGSFEAALLAPAKKWREAGVGETHTLSLPEPWQKPDAELAKAAKLGISILVLSDPRYPQGLRSIYDPPPVLWVRGDLAPLEQLVGVLPRSIGVVGTRQASAYARAFTQKLAHDLALVGVCVVSGLARGIDTVAHSAAVNAGGSSIAVLGCGVDTIYPSENKALSERLTVISAYALGTPPNSYNFPPRNRIIAGLSSGSVVVEGDVTSGAMITAVAALEAGREVFAVPGRAGDPLARGPHKLIKEGATLIESAADVLEALRWTADPPHSAPELIGDEAAVYAALQGEMLLDTLCQKTNLETSRALVALTMLQLKGAVLELPDGRYSRL